MRVESSCCCFPKELVSFVRPSYWVLTHGTWRFLLQWENVHEMGGIIKHNEHIGKALSIQREALRWWFHLVLMKSLRKDWKATRDYDLVVSWKQLIPMTHSDRLHQSTSLETEIKVQDFKFQWCCINCISAVPCLAIFTIFEFFSAIAERIKGFIVVFSWNKTCYKPLGSSQPVRDSQHLSVRSLTRHFPL